MKAEIWPRNNLIGAQDELSWTHKFVESQFLSHRDLINPILEDIQKFSIDLFLDSVETVKEVAQETRQKMAEFGNSLCANASRESWERRVISYGNTLNFCASEATRILNGEFSDLTYFDKDGSRVSNHVQNQGFHIMAQNDIFETRGDYYTLINRRLRDLLLRAGRKLKKWRSKTSKMWKILFQLGLQSWTNYLS